MENYRSRRHCLLLYPDDETHIKALEYIKHNYEHLYILHDKDVYNDTGELKKPHYHVIVEFKSAKWRSALAKELGITENYIEQVNNYEKALEYLVHFNDDEKFPYSFDEVKGTFKDKLYKFMLNDGKDENEKSMELIEYIVNYPSELSVSAFAYWCAKVGKWDVFRRSSHIFIRIIDEHNEFYNKNFNIEE